MEASSFSRSISSKGGGVGHSVQSILPEDACISGLVSDNEADSLPSVKLSKLLISIMIIIMIDEFNQMNLSTEDGILRVIISTIYKT